MQFSIIGCTWDEKEPEIINVLFVGGETKTYSKLHFWDEIEQEDFYGSLTQNDKSTLALGWWCATK